MTMASYQIFKRSYYYFIEKKDKDKRHLSNWRPIPLINHAKIGSKAITKRLENVLINIIQIFFQTFYCYELSTKFITQTIFTEITSNRKENRNIMICIDIKKSV